MPIPTTKGRAVAFASPLLLFLAWQGVEFVTSHLPERSFATEGLDRQTCLKQKTDQFYPGRDLDDLSETALSRVAMACDPALYGKVYPYN